MRVDADAGTPGFELDPKARLRQIVGAFRRRWYLVAVPLLLGSAAGWFTAPQPGSAQKAKPPPVTTPASPYYRATHVLTQETQSDNSRGSSGPQMSLQQAAYLVITGDVPAKVAQSLGLPAEDVEARLNAIPRTDVNSIEIRAVGVDPDQVVKIADTAAAELMAQLKAQAQSTATTQRDSILAQLDQLTADLQTLNGQIAFNPPNRTELEAQQRSLSNQYSMVFQQFTDLANSPPPSAGLVTLAPGKAKRISPTQYADDITAIRNGDMTGTTPPTTIAPGTEPDVAKPSKPASATTRATVGGLAGLLLGIGVVLLLDRFDGRLRRREDVETATGLAVIAEVPPMKRKQARSNDLQAHTAPRSRSAESYRVVRSAAAFALRSIPPPPYEGPIPPAAVLMITSAQPGDGKTVTAANLAVVFAEGGMRVLVVNCDFRRPRIHRYFLDDEATGVDENGVPYGPTAPVDPTRPRWTTIPGVDLITGIGENDPDVNPLEVLALQNHVIDSMRPYYDVIILDTAPFLTTNDASELLRHTDLVIMVVRSGRTTAEAAHRMTEVMERFSAPVAGVVFNASDEHHGAQYYYYSYDDQAPAPAAPQQPAAPPQQSAAPAEADQWPTPPPASNGNGNGNGYSAPPAATNGNGHAPAPAGTNGNGNGNGNTHQAPTPQAEPGQWAAPTGTEPTGSPYSGEF